MIPEEIAFNLSTNHRLAQQTFDSIATKYKQMGVIPIPGYSLRFTFIPDESTDNKLRKLFKLQAFSATQAPRLLVPLQNTDKRIIENNFLSLVKSNASLTNMEKLYTLASVLQLNKQPNSKYILIPVTLDFSKDYNLYHQGAIFIDFQKGVIVAYEPYGTFSKYGYDYLSPIKEFFGIYRNFGKPMRFSSWDQYIGTKMASIPGIQTIILQQTNATCHEFNKMYDQLLTYIEPSLRAKILQAIQEDKNPVNATDCSIKILETIDQMRTSKNMSQETMKKAYVIYGMYTAKTCVTITLGEFMRFFSSPDKILNWRKSYLSGSPHQHLLRDLLELFPSLNT